MDSDVQVDLTIQIVRTKKKKRSYLIAAGRPGTVRVALVFSAVRALVAVGPLGSGCSHCLMLVGCSCHCMVVSCR